MAETKEDIAAERDLLREENEQLRSQLTQATAAPTAAPYAPSARFVLSEGDRQELVQHGQVNINGRMRTADEVRSMLDDDQRGIDLGSAKPPVQPTALQERGAVRGVDYVWPSVAPGEIDPAVAGQPGISGPAADEGKGRA